MPAVYLQIIALEQEGKFVEAFNLYHVKGMYKSALDIAKKHNLTEQIETAQKLVKSIDDVD
ncbi:MAG TPA: hypothetical protein VKE88_01130 [Candidatus Nanoarchaeia archaeon]|nr:hypothetical protein [Candidatus Nanoarchaeia archaeon]